MLDESVGDSQTCMQHMCACLGGGKGSFSQRVLGVKGGAGVPCSRGSDLPLAQAGSISHLELCLSQQSAEDSERMTADDFLSKVGDVSPDEDRM